MNLLHQLGPRGISAVACTVGERCPLSVDVPQEDLQDCRGRREVNCLFPPPSLQFLAAGATVFSGVYRCRDVWFRSRCAHTRVPVAPVTVPGSLRPLESQSAASAAPCSPCRLAPLTVTCVSERRVGRHRVSLLPGGVLSRCGVSQLQPRAGPLSGSAAAVSPARPLLAGPPTAWHAVNKTVFDPRSHRHTPVTQAAKPWAASTTDWSEALRGSLLTP